MVDLGIIWFPFQSVLDTLHAIWYAPGDLQYTRQGWN